MKDILKWARSLEGVTLAKTDIIENQDYVHEWLEREVGRRIQNGRDNARLVTPGRGSKPKKTAAVNVVATAR